MKSGSCLIFHGGFQNPMESLGAKNDGVTLKASYLAILLVTFLGWLSQVTLTERLSDLQRLGMKIVTN